MMNQEQEKYMRRCLQLARNGRQTAAPNPMVGAVIVCDGVIIGEGWHRRCGEAHAEVNAIRSVRRPELLERSTIYVTLEPCSHYGKTPPCADLIIEKRIPRVVVGCVDPFAKVAGGGIRKLRAAGVDVTVGVLEDECRWLIRRFITFHTRKRPYIILKWAQSADGFLDKRRTDGRPAVLSTPLTQLCVHKLRSECQAILVGRRTAVLDNPSLTVRAWDGRDPLRVVLAGRGELPDGLRLLDGSVSTLVFSDIDRRCGDGLELVRYPVGSDGLLRGGQCSAVLDALYARNIQTLLVEGGANTLSSFLDQHLWDEVVVEYADKRLGDGVPAPCISEGLLLESERRMGVDFRCYYNAGHAVVKVLSNN